MVRAVLAAPAEVVVNLVQALPYAAASLGALFLLAALGVRRLSRSRWRRSKFVRAVHYRFHRAVARFRKFLQRGGESMFKEILSFAQVITNIGSS